MKSLVLVAVVAALMTGCGNTPTAPSPVEPSFTADSYSVLVGQTTVLHVSAPGARHCWIEPTYGDVPCEGGSKVVGPFAAAGYYTFTLHADNSTTAALTIRAQ